jgi:hypothetical protein
VFLQAAILEVQRMFPVVPLGVPHGTTRWASLGQYQLPPHCMVMVLHWNLNRDPELWTDPESFRPERFLNETRDSVVIPPHFMPFQVIICFFVSCLLGDLFSLNILISVGLDRKIFLEIFKLQCSVVTIIFREILVSYTKSPRESVMKFNSGN